MNGDENEGIETTSSEQTVRLPDGFVRKYPNIGAVFHLADFINDCRAGYFINYDGSGNYCTAERETDVPIYPSDVARGRILPGYPYVIWYNK